MQTDWERAQQGELEWWIHMLRGQFPDAPRARILAHIQENGRRRLVQFGVDRIGGKILDCGCAIMSPFEDVDGVRVVAIEPLLEALHQAMPDVVRLGCVANADYRCCKIQDVLETDFDAVYCVNVLDHAGDWRDMIANFARVLKSGGLLLLGTDVRYSIKSLNLMHISAFTAEELICEVASVGFAIEWYTPGPHREAKDRYYFCMRAYRQ